MNNFFVNFKKVEELENAIKAYNEAVSYDVNISKNTSATDIRIYSLIEQVHKVTYKTTSQQ